MQTEISKIRNSILLEGISASLISTASSQAVFTKSKAVGLSIARDRLAVYILMQCRGIDKPSLNFNLNRMNVTMACCTYLIKPGPQGQSEELDELKRSESDL